MTYNENEKRGPYRVPGEKSMVPLMSCWLRIAAPTGSSSWNEAYGYAGSL